MTFDDPEIGPSTTVFATSDVPLAEAWRAFVPIDLARVFPERKGPIPPVVGVRDQAGRWDVVGRTRTVLLGDGSEVTETITLSDPADGADPFGGSARFDYTVSGFTGALGRLAVDARGSWTFTARGSGTDIVWRYALRPTGMLTQPVVALLTATFWRRYMQAGLVNVVEILKRADDTS